MTEENPQDRPNTLTALTLQLEGGLDENLRFKLLYELRELVNKMLNDAAEGKIPKKLLEIFLVENLQPMYVPDGINWDTVEVEKEFVRRVLKDFIQEEGMFYSSGRMIFINKGNGRIDYCRSDIWPYEESEHDGIMEMFECHGTIGPPFAKTLMKICGKKYPTNLLK